MYTKTEQRLIPWQYIADAWSAYDDGGETYPFHDAHSDLSQLLSWDQVKSGQSVPGWKTLIKEGKLAASPYQVSFSRLLSSTTTDAVAGYTNPGTSRVKQEFSGSISQPTRPDSVAISDETSNLALSRILGKIRDQYQHTNVLPALAELRQTVSQFGSPMSSILSLVNRHHNRLALEWRGLKGSTAFRRVQWHRILASTYLEFAFGLSPLIEETKKIAEALARWNAEEEGDLPRPTSDLLKASAGKTETSFYQWNGLVVPPMTLMRFSGERRETHETGVRYQVKLNNSLQADFGSNDRLMQLLGFDPINFIPALHEVLPWSWLVDYFLNVQQIIEAGVTNTSNVSWIIRTERVHSVRVEVWTVGKQDTIAGTIPVQWIKNPTTPHGFVSEKTVLSRSIPQSLGLPTLVVSYPHNGRQFANMTAALFARRAQAHALWLF